MGGLNQQVDEGQIRRALPWVLAAALVAWCVPALDQYNLTWDEALGDFFFGDRYLSFFTSFDARYLDFEAEPYPEGRRPDLRLSPFRTRPWEHYPVASTLGALSSRVLSSSLGWVDSFDGFHAANIALAALLLWVFYRFLEPRFGTVTALAATGFLFTSPRIFFHLMANVKDFPLMVFFTLAVLAFFRAYEAGSTRGMLAAGCLWGLALATKANALFLPLIPCALLLLGGLPEAWRGRRDRLLGSLVGAGAAGVAVMVAVWPYLWADPIGRLWQNLEFVLLRKDTTHPDSFAPVLQAIGLTTPPVFLICFAVGLVPCLRWALGGHRAALLMLVWIPGVMARYLVPQAVNYDGVRHFLELFPAMAAIAGLGVAWMAQSVAAGLGGLSSPQWIKIGALTVALMPGAFSLVATHPFQLAYWNAFTGGYAGARARDLPQAGDYWGASYRLGMRWLNEHAPQDALVAVPVVEHAVRLVAPERLRPDLLLLPVTTPFSPRISPERLELTRQAAQKRPLYVMFVERRDWMNDLMRECLERLEPEVTWELEGEPVLAIYRYEPQ
ncbi:MAG: glycosyltransferase family 39 protein [Acidobacteriota bacterium]